MTVDGVLANSVVYGFDDHETHKIIEIEGQKETLFLRVKLSKKIDDQEVSVKVNLGK